MDKYNQQIAYTLYASKNELKQEHQNLIDSALNARTRAYTPYSEFNVGAAVLLENGEVIEGNNQENAAYPSGLCAERVALFYANSRYPEVPVKAIAIAAGKKQHITQDPVTPCGSCRQALLESEIRFRQPISIIMYGTNNILMIENAKSLLPFSFKNDFLLDP